MLEQVRCPKCGAEITLTEALMLEVKRSVSEEMERPLKEREQRLQESQLEVEARRQEIDEEVKEKLDSERKKIRETATKEASEVSELEIKDLRDQLQTKSGKLQEFQERELALLKKTRELEEARQQLELDVERKVQERETEIRKEVDEKEEKLAEKETSLNKRAQELIIERESYDRLVAEEVKKLSEQARDEISKQLEQANQLEKQDLKNQLTERDVKIKQFTDEQLQLRKEKRELEAAKVQLALEVERKLDERSAAIRDEAKKTVTQEFKFQLADKEKENADLRAQITQLKELEQRSQQNAGEVAELALEDELKREFPFDEIREVPKGVRGADVIQVVSGKGGKHCGSIIWESKRTKSWSAAWVEKVKEDQRAAQADVPVIVTTAMPKGVEDFTEIEGVYVISWAFVKVVASILREGLIGVASVRQLAVGKQEKMDLLYTYLTGPEFRQRVEAVVSTFASLRDGIEGERRAMERIWSKRQKQIDRVSLNISGMYGEMEAIAGASMPELKLLSLDQSSQESDELQPDDEQ